jgi:hypothetical protein
VRRIKTWDRVEVEWLDAQSTLTQFTVEEASAMDPIVRKTLGFLIFVDKTKVVLAGTDDRPGAKYCGNIVAADITVIPAPWIEKIIVLEPVK